MTLTAPAHHATAAAVVPAVALEAHDDGYRLTPLADDGAADGTAERVPAAALPERVAGLEAAGVRWVWDTAAVYPALLAAGVRVERAHDVRLARAILRGTTVPLPAYANLPRDGWDEPSADPADGLFALDRAAADVSAADEHRRQQQVVAASPRPGALRLLLRAESAGALAAAEMSAAGLPWRADEHERILAGLLGPRVPSGQRPEALEVLVAHIREALGAPRLNPDSPVELVRALRAAGLTVETTRSSELRRLEHPVIEPLLSYKKLSRLHTANGWHWLDTWVADGRFRPDYVVGGVATGRWATRGGGALQLPKQVRGAVVADPGWRLVVADAAQLEPRVLAGLARDRSMAEAGRGRDLYDGIVATGAVADRSAAKYGMLGALYGATQGAGGRLVPRLAARFPQALGLVEQAARAGERGAVVGTLLGRGSGSPSDAWRAAQAAASDLDASDAVVRRARSLSREHGRFTRNFVVQGTAAEWALCWLADLRRRLWALGAGRLAERPHLVYFLHDEVLVHTPEHLVDEAAEAVREAAAAAGRLLFGDFPVDFPLDVAVVERYSDAT
ncbi:bifunctional 3'-5' exonuclease/DNA polymerase [Amnibacterium sp. CER49]|uniref:bifunctional 3'-5' exonuclease/DNA polymerase n=1 Tax=Amnibacterium sp. CER49 TaxID=3039161 RepID=UPI002448973D|nr:bifunctional 3'-5' exonuclease/DNA polymerase [Amnibacterium sp. CER49]MDH2442359.1 bifunctional 3'-5' exonuclease/DNA polymerase [Amnibacterium sp. CER49]